jgi:hypothetical protein
VSAARSPIPKKPKRLARKRNCQTCRGKGVCYTCGSSAEGYCCCPVVRTKGERLTCPKCWGPDRFVHEVARLNVNEEWKAMLLKIVEPEGSQG